MLSISEKVFFRFNGEIERRNPGPTLARRSVFLHEDDGAIRREPASSVGLAKLFRFPALGTDQESTGSLLAIVAHDDPGAIRGYGVRLTVRAIDAILQQTLSAASQISEQSRVRRARRGRSVDNEYNELSLEQCCPSHTRPA